MILQTLFNIPFFILIYILFHLKFAISLGSFFPFFLQPTANRNRFQFHSPSSNFPLPPSLKEKKNPRREIEIQEATEWNLEEGDGRHFGESKIFAWQRFTSKWTRNWPFDRPAAFELRGRDAACLVFAATKLGNI